MNLVTVSVGRPREISWQDRVVRTSIFKTPVDGRVRVSRLNLDGDEQSDLLVHGGPDKAVYAYPVEHYAPWQTELALADLPHGSFGENLTVDGLIETEVAIGDEYRIGTAEFIVTQPRLPCFKLGIRFARSDIVKLFFDSGRTGFYLRVTREGEIGAGDSIERLTQDTKGLTIQRVFDLYSANAAKPEDLKLASEHPALAAGWRKRFQKLLDQSET